MPLARHTLPDQIVKELQAQIASGSLRPGARLESHEQLATRFGVSRTAIREALKILSSKGLVALRQGDGTYVSRPDPETVVEPPYASFLRERATIVELLEARRHIEVATARLAARHATPEELRAMALLLDGMDEDARRKRLDAITEKAMHFHLLVAVSSRNRILGKILQMVRDLLYHQQREVQRAPGAARRAAARHRRIFVAMKARDEDRAAALMAAHLDDALRRLRPRKAQAHGVGRRRPTGPSGGAAPHARPAR